MSEGHREAVSAISRRTRTRRIEFNKLRATCYVRLVKCYLTAGHVRDLLIRAPTTKLRKTDSRYLFCAAAGRQKWRREGVGLDQTGSSRHAKLR
jgi:hypothetical protein